MQTQGPERGGEPAHPDIVVIGGSAGSLAPLIRIISDLGPELPAAVFIVQHRGEEAPAPVAMLAARSALPVALARDRSPIERGTVHVAPPGRHLLLEQHEIRVLHGPREKNARPGPRTRDAADRERLRSAAHRAHCTRQVRFSSARGTGGSHRGRPRASPVEKSTVQVDGRRGRSSAHFRSAPFCPMLPPL